MLLAQTRAIEYQHLNLHPPRSLTPVFHMKLVVVHTEASFLRKPSNSSDRSTPVKSAPHLQPSCLSRTSEAATQQLCHSNSRIGNKEDKRINIHHSRMNLLPSYRTTRHPARKNKRHQQARMPRNWHRSLNFLWYRVRAHTHQEINIKMMQKSTPTTPFIHRSAAVHLECLNQPRASTNRASPQTVKTNGDPTAAIDIA